MFWAKFSKKLENQKKQKNQKKFKILFFFQKKSKKKCIFLPESMSDIFSENTLFGLCIVFLQSKNDF